MLAVGLSYIIFIMLRNIASIHNFFNVFTIKGDEFCQRLFCFYWEDSMIFEFNSVYMLYYIYRFVYVEPSLHSWNETDFGHGVWSFWCGIEFGLPALCWEFSHWY
jgi:hypothetical protein